MPISAGYVEGKPVTVLEDTGCSGIVVRRSKVDASNLITNKFQTCILADGSLIKVPAAARSINTPYITETFEAWCMAKPVYDLIICKVDHVRPSGNPDPNWTDAHAVETRQQTKEKLKPYPQLKVPKRFRDVVMKLAHTSILPGHLATSRTISRVLSELYWPGVQSDIK